MLYNKLLEKQNNEKMLAILFDPDKVDNKSLLKTISVADKAGVDFFLFGGSIVSKSINDLIAVVKQVSTTPVFLFPGNLFQLCNQADGILLLSLISGRNADYLIGNHVNSAHFIKNSNLEIIPTGYMIIDTGKRTSVEYISNTMPIPADKPDIAVATALAGEMLGLKAIYLEGGSGADYTINPLIISEVKKHITIPLIVGGGIRTSTSARIIFDAGADVIVIGTAAEENHDVIFEIAAARNR